MAVIDDTGALIRYAAIASVAAAALFYVLGPSILPNEEYQGLSKHGAVGLSNTGNDCFINSVLQALSALSKLRAYLQASRQVRDGLTGNDALALNLVTEALSDVLARLQDPAWKGRTTSAKDFIRAFETAFQARLSRRQEDAHELLQFVIEKLDDEAVARAKSQPDENSEAEAHGLPMYGSLESQIECLHCHHEPPATASVFFVLSLNVPQHGDTTLDQCFDSLMKQETINDYVCAKCKVQSIVTQKQQQLSRTTGEAKAILSGEIDRIAQASEKDIEKAADDAALSDGYSVPKRTIAKHTRVAHFPDVLVVHLSRSVFGSYSSKNTAKVSFGEYLKLGTFDRHDYKLASVVTHRGGHNSGHYETFRRQAVENAEARSTKGRDDDGSTALAEKPKQKKQAKEIWWGISDDKVRECRITDVLGLQRECYLLFYEKVEHG